MQRAPLELKVYQSTIDTERETLGGLVVSPIYSRFSVPSTSPMLPALRIMKGLLKYCRYTGAFSECGHEPEVEDAATSASTWVKVPRLLLSYFDHVFTGCDA